MVWIMAQVDPLRIIEFFERERNLIMGAPIHALGIALISGVIVWAIVRGLNRLQLDNAQSENRLLRAQLAVSHPKPVQTEQLGTVEVNGELLIKTFQEIRTTTATSGPLYSTILQPLQKNRVYPFLRSAFALENYDHSTDQLGNDDRLIRPSCPDIVLHWDRYDTEPFLRRPWFNFGIANLHDRSPISSAILTVEFLDLGLIVSAEGDWVTSRDNQEYHYRFQESINAYFGLNTNGLLRVSFPRRDRYTIRLRTYPKTHGKVVNLA